MILTLHRKYLKSDCTIGELYVDGLFECFTLEDKVREPGLKIPGRTAIPYGRYEVILSESPRFKKIMPLLLNVPDFEGIRIHPGNTDEDTEGCILVGKAKGDTAIYSSRIAYDNLMIKLNNAFKIGNKIIMEVTK